MTASPGLAENAVAGGLLFLAGLTSSVHCLGMCGGFPLMLAQTSAGRGWGRQLAYNLARVNTLVAIGALSGAIGFSVLQTGPLWLIERVLPLVAGVFMLLVGLEMLGLVAGITGGASRYVHSAVRTPLQAALRSGSVAAPLALGVFNAFLPCQLVWAFAARAASTASIAAGMWTMLWFGLGTVPAMLAMGTVGRWIPTLVRTRLVAASGVLVIIFAALTLARAFGFPAHDHSAMHVH
jgi:sulfite exporter TauE/SafE